MVINNIVTRIRVGYDGSTSNVGGEGFFMENSKMDFDEIDDNVLNDMLNLSEFHENNHENIENDGVDYHLEVLSKYFGHQNFRPLQWQIIENVMVLKRDVCAVMATGSGKSLCYQFPSVYTGGVTIVVSPLISLMEDQVLSLKILNIPACLLGTAQQAKSQTISDIFNNKYRLIYVTPEFCTGDYGQEFIKNLDSKLTIDLIAIDEAHCVSTWGHDFRFQYRKLHFLKSKFPKIPILAVTATATKKVQDDIIKSLKLNNCLVVCSGFDRPNLYFEVHLKGSNGILSDLKRFMITENSQLKFNGPTIIYCISRKQTEQLADTLKCSGVKCSAYHAGLSLSKRKETHESFVKDKIDAIVATIAFGMGIDKPDIRNVIHYGAARSVEEYYQEVGRASRDGLPANCVTFYNAADFSLHRKMVDLIEYASNETKSRKLKCLEIMENYLKLRTCRRRFILEYIDDTTTLDENRSNCCDNCTNLHFKGDKSDHEIYENIDKDGFYDFTNDSRMFLNAVDIMQGKYGITTYILFIKGSDSAKIQSRYKKHPAYGSGKHQTQEWWKAIGSLLLQKKYLEENFQRTTKFTISTVSVTNLGLKFLTDNQTLLEPPPPDILKLLKRKPQQSTGWIKPSGNPSGVVVPPKQINVNKEPIPVDDSVLYQKLLDKRTALASSHDCMPYMVASNNALLQMSKLKPTTLEALSNCQLDGFTEAKITKFGQPLLNVVKSCCPNESQQKLQTIQEILTQHPLPNVKLINSAELTCKMFMSGLKPEEIVERRKFVLSTVLSHLINGIIGGLPIKMVDLGISEDKRLSILRAMKQLSPDSPSLTDIKNNCPEDVSWDDIRIVKAYNDVRTHLEQLHMSYEEFEDFNYHNLKSTFKDDESKSNLSMFLDICKKIQEDDGNQSESSSNLDPSILECKHENSQNQSEITESSLNSDLPAVECEKDLCEKDESVTTDKVEKGVIPRKKSKVVLPPWLRLKHV